MSRRPSNTFSWSPSSCGAAHEDPTLAHCIESSPTHRGHVSPAMLAGIKNPGQEAIHAPVRGEASMPARLEYLMTCIKVKDDKIETLKLQLQTVRMNREL